MPVTVTKKMTLKQAKNAEQNEKDLFWISSLRQLVPPVGNEDKWKEMSPVACKLYLLIWALDSARFQIPTETTPYNGVHPMGLFLYSGLKQKALKNAIGELLELELIKDNVDWPYNEDGADSRYSLVYNLPADVIENGV